MKFLQLDGLETLNSALAFETPECRVFGSIEPYSCKAAGSDKKLYKQIEIKYDPSHSPPEDDGFRYIISPFGPLDQAASRRTLFYLIGTLNASFPDYDFSEVKPEQFRKETSVAMVINSVNLTLLSHGNTRAVKDLRIWDAIDSLIDFEDSDVYSYNPESDSDPNDEEGAGTLWSFNYFFFNKKMKRIIYFTMRGVSYGAPSEDDDFSDMSEDDIGFAPRRRSLRHDDFVAGEMDML
ncbi:hypothetical protein EMPS_09960 [Entomortierella parvispora]|uniref:Repressor of RNA polymerase III transcription MAF1 n=1 Tax=Entomortierella parvispora TaxID=205924 RepID=A0A9P3HJ57_9FUNG|nr:hypothetical protein EMPS_09960 [Entomortierella parvispora]